MGRARSGAWITGFGIATALGSVGPNPVAGQDLGRLVGTVVSDAGGAPVPGALVLLENGQQARASLDGSFFIDGVPAGTQRIAAVAQGCESGIGVVDVPGSRETRVVVQVPIEPRAPRRSGGAADGATLSLNREELLALEVQTVHDALRVIAPYMVSGTPGQIGATPRVRNRVSGTIVGPSTPLVILDGARVTDMGGDALVGIRVQDLETLEVARGSVGAWRYGFGGANGAIIMTTRRESFGDGTSPEGCGFVFPR